MNRLNKREGRRFLRSDYLTKVKQNLLYLSGLRRFIEELSQQRRMKEVFELTDNYIVAERELYHGFYNLKIADLMIDKRYSNG